MLQKLKKIILDAIFPPMDISGAPVFQTMFCSVCRARLARGAKICHKTSLYKLAAATAYDGPVKNLLLKFKYGKKQAALLPFQTVLASYGREIERTPGLKNYALLPIPLSPRKERERGFNQAQNIAHVLSRQFGLPILNNVLVKAKDTSQQADQKDWEARKKNVTGSFVVMRPEAVKGKKIMLVDDVWTSGATMNEAARVLKEAGAKQMIGFVIAKAG